MDAVVASTMPVPAGHGHSSGGVADVLVVVVVLAAVAVCLFLFFRRGSVADRSRRQDAGDGEQPPDQP